MANTPLSDRKFMWVFLSWWITWAGLQTWVLSSLGYSLQLSITDSAISNILLALACALVSNNLQFYVPRLERYWYIIILSLVLSSLWAFLTYKFLLWLPITNEDNYRSFLLTSVSVRFTLSFLLIVCMAMISVLWYTFEEQKETARRKSEAEQLSKDAELFKLRTQLQPHFLFNSLNSINALIGIKPELARKMVQQLSEFLRGTLRREEHQWIELNEELQHLQLYLDIEKVRFGQRLSTRFETPEPSLKARIPAMLLQPLVENAIKFGLYDTTDAIEIVIESSLRNNLLEISVQNPFDPETARPRQGTGFGLSSVERRLYLLFARTDLLWTSANRNLFTTTVKIPQP